jgi:hypothetical protein
MPAAKTITADAILDAAAGELGYREGPGNDNKFGRYFKANGSAWCAQFVSWCAEEAGATRDTMFPETAWCPDLVAWGRRTNRIVRDPVKGDRSGTPAPGDIMLLQRVKSDPLYSSSGAKHVGLVEKSLPGGRIQTIEGNTSDNGSAQGNGVYRLIRTLTDRIIIVRPSYDKPKPKMITIMGKQHEDISVVTVGWINDRRKSGDFSRHIYYLQLWLGKIDADYKVTLDGKWDTETQAALDEFRRERCDYKGDDAKGSIGIGSLTKARDLAKSTKKVKE